MKLEEITQRYEHPIIGIIGATSPLPDYDSDDAFRLGYDLREFVEEKGSLFTGGVQGVGVDIYSGIVDYCLEKNVGDKFFILFPDFELAPPEEYFKLAEKTKNGILRMEKAGKDMEERRVYIGGVADYLIVVNGSTGTIDEALKGLLLEKPVICLQNSGGAAEALSKLKKGEAKIPLEVDTDLIKPFDSITEIINYLSNERESK
ncbi:hypothetical protein HYT56_02235 [Candidatus Woesearchaeota archaeon]|nr:hypothetical protein [Candidatus Woesearchaeota archaeon]